MQGINFVGIMKVKLAFCMGKLRVKWLKTGISAAHTCSTYYRQCLPRGQAPHIWQVKLYVAQIGLSIVRYIESNMSSNPLLGWLLKIFQKGHNYWKLDLMQKAFLKLPL